MSDWSEQAQTSANQDMRDSPPEEPVFECPSSNWETTIEVEEPNGWETTLEVEDPVEWETRIVILPDEDEASAGEEASPGDDGETS